jgi:hypothetical protein
VERPVGEALHPHRVLVDVGAGEIAREFDGADVELLEGEVIDALDEHARAGFHVGARVGLAVGRERVEVVGAKRHDRVDVLGVECRDVLLVPRFDRLADRFRLVGFNRHAALGLDLDLGFGRFLRDDSQRQQERYCGQAAAHR